MLAAMVVEILNSGMISIPMTLHIMELTAVVTQMFWATLMPIRAAAFLFWATQRMAFPIFVKFINN